MHTIPELTLTIIALNLDAPPAPPMLPPNAAEALELLERRYVEAHTMLERATTNDERADAWMWIDAFDREIVRWRAAHARQRGC